MIYISSIFFAYVHNNGINFAKLLIFNVIRLIYFYCTFLPLAVNPSKSLCSLLQKICVLILFCCTSSTFIIVFFYLIFVSSFSVAPYLPLYLHCCPSHPFLLHLTCLQERWNPRLPASLYSLLSVVTRSTYGCRLAEKKKRFNHQWPCPD